MLIPDLSPANLNYWNLCDFLQNHKFQKIYTYIYIVANLLFLFHFFAAPHQTLNRYWGNSLTKPMLVTIWPEGHKEPCNKFGSPSQAKHLVGFELETFHLMATPSPTRSLYCRKYRDIAENMIFCCVLTEDSSCLRILHKKVTDNKQTTARQHYHQIKSTNCRGSKKIYYNLMS